MKIGSLSDHINRKTFIILLLQFVIVVALQGFRTLSDSSAESIPRHSDSAKMSRAGCPQFYITSSKRACMDAVSWLAWVKPGRRLL